MLCGGGSEGDLDDLSAWSAVAYGALLEGGDVTGDGLVTVAVLATGEESNWIPQYFERLGADDAFNVRVGTRTAANDDDIATDLADVDAVFLKGGDQGEYYDAWNGTALEDAILAVAARGGGIGGTSAGAMSQAEYALAGGNDYVTADVLADATTAYLDDVSDGGSGIHTDFLGLLPDTFVDTHVGTRARLGRMVGAMARAIAEGAPSDLLGIGLDEQTCITVRERTAAVNGVGSVVFLRPGAEVARRDAGSPLVWAGLTLDRLTDGWVYDLDAGVDTAAPPDGAEAIAWDGVAADPGAEAWSVDGAVPTDEEGFAWVVERAPDAWGLHAGTASVILADTVGILDAHDSDTRGVSDEAFFRALYEHPAASGFLVGEGGALTRDAGAPSRVALRGTGATPLATMVVTGARAAWRSLSPSVSPADAGDGGLHAAGLVGLELHVLYGDGEDGRGWDVVERVVVP